MKCIKCKKTMDEENEDFCKEYNTDTCFKCCGKEYEENAKKGIYYHSSIPVYDGSQSIVDTPKEEQNA